ncbi:hypothetical protein CANCADRAFT_140312 [Tortispora caseinolytica NRRL Y-17796]|uniref:Uncharacterized protein n=1 Tax=Tortispora caseinolytica NRRL Y-17796 TaxID=767744 RepID=A0A1E4TCQ5_9ASCO|nr:hypothetical protein CANCADRAFT_140312 [Tortispora caseinolytica NRRL Y-17796]
MKLSPMIWVIVTLLPLAKSHGDDLWDFPDDHDDHDDHDCHDHHDHHPPECHEHHHHRKRTRICWPRNAFLRPTEGGYDEFFRVHRQNCYGHYFVTDRIADIWVTPSCTEWLEPGLPEAKCNEKHGCGHAESGWGSCHGGHHGGSHGGCGCGGGGGYLMDPHNITSEFPDFEPGSGKFKEKRSDDYEFLDQEERNRKSWYEGLGNNIKSGVFRRGPEPLLHHHDECHHHHMDDDDDLGHNYKGTYRLQDCPSQSAPLLPDRNVYECWDTDVDVLIIGI